MHEEPIVRVGEFLRSVVRDLGEDDGGEGGGGGHRRPRGGVFGEDCCAMGDTGAFWFKVVSIAILFFCCSASLQSMLIVDALTRAVNSEALMKTP